MISYNRGFGLIVALAFIFFAMMIMIDGCVSFRSKGDSEPITERAERICKETGGTFVNSQCDYSNPSQADTTVAMLGLQT